MAKYLIERNVPGAHELFPEQLKALMQKSYSVMLELSSDVLWVQSYITEDKFTCIYIAPNTELLFEHARRSGFPVGRISEIKSIIDPTFSEALMAAEAICKVEVDHGKTSCKTPDAAAYIKKTLDHRKNKKTTSKKKRTTKV